MDRETRMSQYFKSVWAMLSPSKEENSPLLPEKSDDLEACVYGSAAASDSIVVVCGSPEGPANSHVRESPFSGDHFSPWPLISSDA